MKDLNIYNYYYYYYYYYFTLSVTYQGDNFVRYSGDTKKMTHRQKVISIIALFSF